MFTPKAFLSLKDYFIFLSTDEKSYFEVMSKNTFHCWNIVDCGTFFRLYHKHDIHDDYHIHGEFGSLLDCVLEAVQHDEWKCKIWRYKNKGKVKQVTYYDKLIRQFVS